MYRAKVLFYGEFWTEQRVLRLDLRNKEGGDRRFGRNQTLYRKGGIGLPWGNSPLQIMRVKIF